MDGERLRGRKREREGGREGEYTCCLSAVLVKSDCRIAQSRRCVSMFVCFTADSGLIDDTV